MAPMNGELAHCLDLVVLGNVWLASGGGDSPDLIDTPMFRFARIVQFTLDRGSGGSPVTASTTAEWFAGLRAREIRRLRAVSQEGQVFAGVPRFQGAGFAGNGQWAIVAEIDDARAELWQGHGVVNRAPGAPMPEDKRIWDERYIGAQIEAPPLEPVDVAARQAQLLASVDDAQRFATAEGWTQWADWLAKAQAIAAADDPGNPEGPDLIPQTAPLAVRRLFATASQAWVFGGMGWWNDMGASPGHEQDYDRISAELYDAVVEGLITAANAAVPGLGCADPDLVRFGQAEDR
jgi:hypothetical protein